MTKNIHLLIISDKSSYVDQATNIAINNGAKVTFFDQIDDAIKHVREGKGADLIICDVNRNISELIQKLELERIYLMVVACGIESNSSAAVKAIKAGAKEYLPLPPDQELIAAIIESISTQDDNLVYKSQKMAEILKIINQVANSEATILITGESGTGKEMIARRIFELSNRKNQSYVTLNCAAIPDSLMESELFGHEKGAFTGALARRIGKFEEANNGTILLDEISEMDMKLQSKFLRVLQEKIIERIGSNNSINLNVRVIATSNRNLLEEVSEGNFRQDLYYRLNVINIHIPPLRERKEDILPLTNHFVAQFCRINDLNLKEIDDKALQKLEEYNWPGNVRELENTIHRAVLLSDQLITAEKIIIEQNSSKQNNTGNVGRTVEDVEKELILDTLKYCLGNKTHAANVLGISIRTLRNKLKQYQEVN